MTSSDNRIPCNIITNEVDICFLTWKNIHNIVLRDKRDKLQNDIYNIIYPTLIKQKIDKNSVHTCVLVCVFNTCQIIHRNNKTIIKFQST